MEDTLQDNISVTCSLDSAAPNKGLRNQIVVGRDGFRTVWERDSQILDFSRGSVNKQGAGTDWCISCYEG